MIVVSDTTPLNYLVLLGHVDVLPRLYESIYVPTTVMMELSDPGTPEIVRAWAAEEPSWLQILPAPGTNLESLRLLDAGERDAIELAILLKAQIVLTDDRKARLASSELNLQTVTTLLVLAAAADRGWLNLQECFAKLRRTNFRVREETLQELLEKQGKINRGS